MHGIDESTTDSDKDLGQTEPITNIFGNALGRIFKDKKSRKETHYIFVGYMRYLFTIGRLFESMSGESCG